MVVEATFDCAHTRRFLAGLWTTTRNPAGRDSVTAMPTDPSAPQLAPATRLLWRSPEVLHLELGTNAVTVEGLPPEAVGRIAVSPVSAHPRSHPDPIPSGPSRPRRRARPAADQPEVTAALGRLQEAGFLWTAEPMLSGPDRPGSGGPDADPRLHPPSPRLAAQLTSLSTRHGERAVRVLRARHESAVSVGGCDRVAVLIAALLAAAGVGRVYCTADGPARLHHAIPGGVAPSDEGRDLAAAAEDAVRRAAPEVDTTALPADHRPDLTVVALEGPIDDDRRAALHANGGAYLAVELGADSASIGPLVLPGLTSCLRCADLHRTDRDPAWPALAVQLALPRRYGPASDVALATLLAGTAALQALAFLDGDDPATVEGTLELRLPDWRLRRRTRPAHPSCGCMGSARPPPARRR